MILFIFIMDYKRLSVLKYFINLLIVKLICFLECVVINEKWINVLFGEYVGGIIGFINIFLLNNILVIINVFFILCIYRGMIGVEVCLILKLSLWKYFKE